MRRERAALDGARQALGPRAPQRLAQPEPVDRELAGAACRGLGAVEEPAPDREPSASRRQVRRGPRGLPQPMLRQPVSVHRLNLRSPDDDRRTRKPPQPIHRGLAAGPHLPAPRVPPSPACGGRVRGGGCVRASADVRHGAPVGRPWSSPAAEMVQEMMHEMVHGRCKMWVSHGTCGERTAPDGGFPPLRAAAGRRLRFPARPKMMPVGAAPAGARRQWLAPGGFFAGSVPICLQMIASMTSSAPPPIDMSRPSR